MPVPTEDQIEAEIKTLTGMLVTVRPRTKFGDSNLDAIQAQIDTLRERLTEYAVMDDMESEDNSDDTNGGMRWNEREGDSARDAANWLAGDRDEAPSSDWKPLCE